MHVFLILTHSNHRFNAPYQLSGLFEYSHEATMGASSRIQLFANDIIVMGSDGLWDNLFDHEILQILRDFSKKNPEILRPIRDDGSVIDTQKSEKMIQELADTIGHQTLKRAKSKEESSPFEVAAKQAHGPQAFKGGKMDDITVLVSQVWNH